MRCGIGYETELRARVEAACVRRQLAFAIKLPNGGQVREAAERSLELCAADDGYWSDTAFKERHVEGSIEAMISGLVGARFSDFSFSAPEHTSRYTGTPSYRRPWHHSPTPIPDEPSLPIL